MDTTWTLRLQEDPETCESIVEFPPELLESMGWKEGDTFVWEIGEEGEIILSKTDETEWVLVETLSQFKTSYLVEVPKGKTEYALDTVTMEDAKEFSSEHLRPTDIVINHRIVTKEEALALCDERNPYGASWDEETKFKNFFTTWKEQSND